jgi:hypothetical protein
MGECMECKMEERIKALENWKADSKKFHSDFYDWQRKQIERDARLDVTLATMDTNLKKVVKWQEDQMQKPGKLLDGAKEKALYTIAGAFVMWILAGMPGL